MLRLVVLLAAIAVIGFVWWASDQFIKASKGEDKEEEVKKD